MNDTVQPIPDNLEHNDLSILDRPNCKAIRERTDDDDWVRAIAHTMARHCHALHEVFCLISRGCSRPLLVLWLSILVQPPSTPPATLLQLFIFFIAFIRRRLQKNFTNMHVCGGSAIGAWLLIGRKYKSSRAASGA